MLRSCHGSPALPARHEATADDAVGPVVVVNTFTQTDDVVGRRSQGTQTEPFTQALQTSQDKRLELEQKLLDEYKKRRHAGGGYAAPKKRRPPDEGSEDIDRESRTWPWGTGRRSTAPQSRTWP